MLNATSSENLKTVSGMSIRKFSRISNNAGNGTTLPLVACEDIAECGTKCLLDDEAHNKEHIILGPERVSFMMCVSSF